MLKRITLLATAIVGVGMTTLVNADTFAVDTAHSSVVFKILHVGAANFYGRFNKTEGAVKEDAGVLTTVEATVDVDSVDTAIKNRDDHLKGPDFFDVKQYATITFKSTSIKKTEEGKYEVTGELTLHGTTKTITVPMTRTGAGKNVKGQEVVGYETTFTVKRTDYGVSGYPGAIGDDVTLMVSLESIKQ